MSSQNSLANLSAQTIFSQFSESLQDEFVEVVKERLIQQAIDEGSEIITHLLESFKPNLSKKETIKFNTFIWNPRLLDYQFKSISHITEKITKESIEDALGTDEFTSTFVENLIICPGLVVRIPELAKYQFENLSDLFRFLKIIVEIYQVSVQFKSPKNPESKNWNETEENLKDYFDSIQEPCCNHSCHSSDSDSYSNHECSSNDYSDGEHSCDG